MTGVDHSGWIPKEQRATLAAQLSPHVLALVTARITAGPDPEGTLDRLLSLLEVGVSPPDDQTWEDVCAIAASSRALTRTLVQHPALLAGAPSGSTVTLQLRSALISSAGPDLSRRIDLAEATSRFSEAIDAIVHETLQAARQAVAGQHPVVDRLPFVVVGMGKWGAMELNYASDIDLVFVSNALPVLATSPNLGLGSFNGVAAVFSPSLTFPAGEVAQATWTAMPCSTP